MLAQNLKNAGTHKHTYITTAQPSKSTAFGQRSRPHLPPDWQELHRFGDEAALSPKGRMLPGVRM